MTNATYTGFGELRGLRGLATIISQTMAIFELDNSQPEEDRTYRVALSNVLFDEECEVVPHEED